MGNLYLKKLKNKWLCISNGIQGSPSLNVKTHLLTKDSKLILVLSLHLFSLSYLNQHGVLLPMLLREHSTISMASSPCGISFKDSMVDYLNHSPLFHLSGSSS